MLKRRFRYIAAYRPGVTIALAKLTTKQVEKLRKRFEAGDQTALLDAVDACLRAGLVVPEWAATPFCERYDGYRLLRVKTLDAAFGVQRPPKMKFPERSRRMKDMVEITRRIVKLRAQGVKGEELYERAASGLRGVTQGRARALFYDPDNRANRKLAEALLKMPKGPPRKF